MVRMGSSWLRAPKTSRTGASLQKLSQHIGCQRSFHCASSRRAEDLFSYGVDLVDLFHHAATQIDKILKGTNPGEIPIYQATKFELVINLKAARALNLTIPPSLLATADAVIE